MSQDGNYKAGDLEEAVKWIKQIMQSDSDNMTAYEKELDSLVKLGRHEEALACANSGIKRCSMVMDAGMMRESELDAISKTSGVLAKIGAVQLEDLGRPEEALKLYIKAAEANPDDHEACEKTGEMLMEQGRSEEAQEWYRRAIDVEIDRINQHMDSPELLTPSDLILYDEATYVLPEEAIKARNIGKARTHLRSGKAEEALSILADLANKEPHLAPAHIWQGLALQKLGRTDEAIICFDKAAKTSKDTRALHAKAACFDEAGKTMDAIKSYDDLIRAGGASSQILLKKAILHFDAGDEKSYAKYLDESLMADPDNMEALAHKAKLFSDQYEKTGDPSLQKKSLEMLDKSINLHPKKGSFIAMKAVLLAQSPDTAKEAIKLFAEAEKIEPLPPPFMIARGHVLLDSGQKQEAYECFKHVPSDDPDIIDVQFTMGTIAESAKRYGAAYKHYRKALKAAPDFEAAKLGKKRTAKLMRYS